MKFWTILLLVVSIQDSLAQSTLPGWALEKWRKYEDRYWMAHYIQPNLLTADLSGDGKEDLAMLVERKSDKKKGLIFFLSDSKLTYILGAGNSFATIGDHFEWANKWIIYDHPITYETTFKPNGDVDDERKIELSHPAISIREEEGSGGLIYFDGKQFNWIHQGD